MTKEPSHYSSVWLLFLIYSSDSDYKETDIQVIIHKKRPNRVLSVFRYHRYKQEHSDAKTYLLFTCIEIAIDWLPNDFLYLYDFCMINVSGHLQFKSRARARTNPYTQFFFSFLCVRQFFVCLLLLLLLIVIFIYLKSPASVWVSTWGKYITWNIICLIICVKQFLVYCLWMLWVGLL